MSAFNGARYANVDFTEMPPVALGKGYEVYRAVEYNLARAVRSILIPDCSREINKHRHNPILRRRVSEDCHSFPRDARARDWHT